MKYTVISEPDNGIFDAMNKGIARSTGSIVGMINSDDWYEHNAIERAAETYKKTNYDMMFADLMIHSRNKTYVKKSKMGRWVTSRTWNHPTTFTKRTIYDGYAFPCRWMYDDFDLYIKLRREKKNIVVLNEVLAHFRIGGASSKKTLCEVLNGIANRYKTYRENGYSRIYLLECILIEMAKFTLF